MQHAAIGTCNVQGRGGDSVQGVSVQEDSVRRTVFRGSVFSMGERRFPFEPVNLDKTQIIRYNLHYIE